MVSNHSLKINPFFFMCFVKRLLSNDSGPSVWKTSQTDKNIRLGQYNKNMQDDQENKSKFTWVDHIRCNSVRKSGIESGSGGNRIAFFQTAYTA